MADTTIDTLTGLYTRLSGFTELTDIVGTRIYSNIPQQTAFPYVRFMISDSDNFDTKSASDYNHRVRVQCFSRTSDQLQALQMRKAVFNALDRKEANVTIAGATVVRLQKADLATVFKEDDHKTWQSVIEFDLVVQAD